MKIKPINIVFDAGVPHFLKEVVEPAVNQLVRLAGVNPNYHHMPINNYGVWREGNWLDEKSKLAPFQSVDWYVMRGRLESQRSTQLHANTLLSCLWVEPWREHQDHYDLLVVSEDMYADNTNFVLGLGAAGAGTVISVNRFLRLPQQTATEIFRTLVYHEMGHAFGIIAEGRTTKVTQSLGRHCTSFGCSMQQGQSFPTDWQETTRQRLQVKEIYCKHCLEDLRKWFWE